MSAYNQPENNTGETILFKARPSIRAIAFGFCGTVFFGAFLYLTLRAYWNTPASELDKTSEMFLRIILGVFICFSSACFFKLLTVKTIVLTNKRIIIKRPLLFLKRIIPLSSIKIIIEKNYNIKPSLGRGGVYTQEVNVYSGFKTIVELNDGRKVRFNSFEISGYSSLIKKLHNAVNKSFPRVKHSP